METVLLRFEPHVIENEILNSDGGIASVTLGLGERILNGETPELFTSNGYIIYKIIDKDDLILMIDPKTGIVIDVYNGISGSYCYHDDITEDRKQQSQDLISSDPDVKPDWQENIIDASISMGAIVGASEVMGEGTILAGGAAFAPGLIIGSVIIYLDTVRQGAVTEAEANGDFNTADWLKNHNLLELGGDLIYGTEPQGVWDESNEYIRNNSNVQQNLEDIKNLKENIQTAWNEIISTIGERQNWTIERLKLNKVTGKLEKDFSATWENEGLGGDGDLGPRLKALALLISGVVVSSVVADATIEYLTVNNTNNNSSILLKVLSETNTTYFEIDPDGMTLSRS